MRNVLVIDAGTGSCRAVVFDETGRMLSSSAREWHYTPDHSAEGACTFDPDSFMETVVSCMKEAAAGSRVSPGGIAAVTVTSQREGMVYLDGGGREIYCAPSLDLRGESVLDHLEPHRGRIYDATGLPLHGMFGLARLMWFREHDRERYDKIRTAFMICDWIAYRLCGERTTEASVFSSSQLFDVKKRCFASGLLDEIGLRSDIFPQLKRAGEPVGELLPEIAKSCGLEGNLPVSIGGSDTHAGLLGTGACRSGEIGVIAGTTTPVMALSDAPFPDPGRQLFLNCHLVEGLWANEANAGSTGLSLRRVKSLFGWDERSYEELESEAAKAPPASLGMSAHIGSELAGQRMGENIGGFIFPVPFDIEEVKLSQFFRASIETNAYAVRRNLNLICGRRGIVPERILLGGGQSKGELFPQILSDVTDCPVVTGEVKESTSLGASVAAFAGAGVYGSAEEAVRGMIREGRTYYPDPENVKIYEESYCRWLSLYERLNKED